MKDVSAPRLTLLAGMVLVVMFYPVGVVLLYVSAHMYQKIGDPVAPTIRGWAIALTILPVVAFAGLLLLVGLEWR